MSRGKGKKKRVQWWNKGQPVAPPNQSLPAKSSSESKTSSPTQSTQPSTRPTYRSEKGDIVELKKAPRLIISEQVWDKIMYMSRNDENNECSGFGMLQITEQGDFLVTDAFMVEQVNGKAETEMTLMGSARRCFWL